MSLVHRFSAVFLCLGLIAGNAAVCAGWAVTPQARMACCGEGGECAMHNGRSEDAHSHAVITQAQADACCAASEQHQSKSSHPTAVTAISPEVLGVGVVIPVMMPSLMLTDGWRTDAPIQSPPVARHVLLSVFLV